MPRLLVHLLEAGLIEKLDGNDDRFAKMMAASDALSTRLAETPSALIGATLAGLDPNAPASDPMMAAAKAALVQQWPTMATVYPDPPVNTLRALLLDACHDIGTKRPRLGAIVWLSAVDRLRLMGLGPREVVPIRDALMALGTVCETEAMSGSAGLELGQLPALRLGIPKGKRSSASTTVKRAALKKDIEAATAQVPYIDGHQRRGNADAYAEQMAQAIAKSVDRALAELGESSSAAALETALAPVIDGLKKTLDTQRQWLRDSLKSMDQRIRVGDTRLNALWWAETLYSPALKRSYHALPPETAAVAMALDLAAMVDTPAPASVGYLLAEKVAGLRTDTDESRSIGNVLDALRTERQVLPAEWISPLTVSSEGRLSVRDLVILALRGEDGYARSGLPEDAALTLPDLAHAVFRQAQAQRLAEALS